MAFKTFILDNIADRSRRHEMINEKAREYFGTPEAEVVYSSKGKPSVTGVTPEKYVSVTTTGAVMVVVFSDMPVGVDGEYLGRFSPGDHPEYTAIAERFFSEEEADYVRDNDGDPTAFARVWVRKEAYVKYTGRGLSEFPSFSVTDGERFFSKVNGVPIKRFAVNFPGSSDYIFAIAGNE